MRPIRLEISGLHSFRENQVIKFDELLDTGVFGIFGPTGSGKSSILDAITLALYGTVERAANHTQGILNHAEDRLSVKFSFSLSSGERMKVCRAERSYRRTGEKSVSSAVCRLVETTGGQEKVLVAKEKEMTKAVTELLGLNVDDFTRAVVLPQGKFAEFLTIKPRDRREMLERIFALETYGKRLNQKLSDRQRLTELAVNGTEQRLLGLGDASPARIAEAQAELEEALIQVTTADEQLALLRRAQEEAKAVWTLQEEMAAVEQRQKQMAVEQGDIKSLEARLALAEKAETVRPLIQAVKLAQNSYASFLAEGKRLEEKRSQAEQECLTALKRWQESHQERTEREPELLRLIERLEQARAEEKLIAEKREELRQKQEQYRRLSAAKTELTAQLAQSVEEFEAEKTGLQALKERLAAISIDPGERERVGNAAQALKAYQIVFKRIEEDEKRYQENLEQLQVLDAAFQEHQALINKAQERLDVLRLARQRHQAIPLKEEDISRRVLELEQYRARVTNLARMEDEVAKEKENLKQELLELVNLEAEVKRLAGEYQESLRRKEVLEQEIAEQKKALKELENQNLAAYLAAELKEGMPCPVCGSSHHPQPVLPLSAEVSQELKARLEVAEKTLASLNQTQQDISTRLAVAESRVSLERGSIEKIRLSLETKEKEIVRLKEAFPPEERALTAAELQLKLQAAEQGLALEREAWLQYTQEGEKLAQDLLEAQDALAKIKEQSEQIRLKQAAGQRAVEDLSSRLAELRVERERNLVELDEARGSIKIEEIIGLQKQYALWDKEAAEINRKLSAAEENIRLLEQKQQTLQEEKNTLELELKELEVSGQETRKALTELEAKFREVTGGASASQLLIEKQKELERLAKADEESKNIYAQAEKNKNQAEQEYAVWKRELELKRQSMQEAEAKLEAGLREAGFVTVAAVENALFEEKERLEMAEMIKRFQQEEIQVRAKYAELAAKLGDRHISPEEWLAWPLRIKEAEERQRAAVQRSGAAKDNLQRLREKHAEWAQLEQERKALAQRMELIKSLQSILRGNSFVEFIAEEQLVNVAYDASERLAELTNYRYALEVDSEGGFVIRDDANGGFRRPVSSLSGGETFLTSLALALALSCQIQLHGEAPLEFFFLDEGFGTLDNNLLEIVMTTLEKLHLQNLTIGIISHVPELRSRLARRLIVEAAEPGGAGSRVRLERA